MLRALFIGMTIGLYDSLYGPGGGTIAMLLFTFLLKYDVRHGLRKREAHADRFQLHSASLLYPFRKCVLHDRDPVCCKQRSRNYIGAGFAIKNGAKIIRPVMICVVTVLIVKIVLESKMIRACLFYIGTLVYYHPFTRIRFSAISLLPSRKLPALSIPASVRDRVEIEPFFINLDRSPGT